MLANVLATEEIRQSQKEGEKGEGGQNAEGNKCSIRRRESEAESSGWHAWREKEQFVLPLKLLNLNAWMAKWHEDAAAFHLQRNWKDTVSCFISRCCISSQAFLTFKASWFCVKRKENSVLITVTDAVIILCQEQKERLPECTTTTVFQFQELFLFCSFTSFSFFLCKKTWFEVKFLEDTLSSCVRRSERRRRERWDSWRRDLIC